MSHTNVAALGIYVHFNQSIAHANEFSLMLHAKKRANAHGLFHQRLS
jgi:hypothetical protein